MELIMFFQTGARIALATLLAACSPPDISGEWHSTLNLEALKDAQDSRSDAVPEALVDISFDLTHQEGSTYTGTAVVYGFLHTSDSAYEPSVCTMMSGVVAVLDQSSDSSRIKVEHSDTIRFCGDDQYPVMGMKPYQLRLTGTDHMRGYIFSGDVMDLSRGESDSGGQ
jgi:hypothetical protein